MTCGCITAAAVADPVMALGSDSESNSLPIDSGRGYSCCDIPTEETIVSSGDDEETLNQRLTKGEAWT